MRWKWCRYALKELNLQPMQRKEREDCVNEVRILASSIHSSSIVRYYDAFMEGDSLWIVTELARGGDVQAKLKRHVKRGELLSEDLIWAFFIQICQGLKALHTANILHRDIKAPNIFITGPRTVKIGDLGVAKCTKHGMAQTQIGTPYYMSPEVWRNQKYDKKSDIWSLGVLLYELATFKHPFTAQNERALASKVLRGQYPALPKSFSSDMSSVVQLMLQVDPNKRPTASQLLEHPLVLKHMDSMPSRGEENQSSSNMLVPVGTIHMPRSLMDLQSRLPGAKYDTDSVYSDDVQTERSRGSDEPRRNRRRVMPVAQSADDNLHVFSRSKSESAYSKKGARIEMQHVRKSHPPGDPPTAGLFPPLSGAVPPAPRVHAGVSRGSDGSVMSHREHLYKNPASRPLGAKGCSNRNKLPLHKASASYASAGADGVGGGRNQNARNPALDMYRFQYMRRRPW